MACNILGKNITIKFDFGAKYIEVQKHPITENEDKHHPGTTIIHLKYMAKNVDGEWIFVVKVPNHNHRASPPEALLMHQLLDNTGHCCGHCVVRGMGHNSKTCPELW